MLSPYYYHLHSLPPPSPSVSLPASLSSSHSLHTTHSTGCWHSGSSAYCLGQCKPLQSSWGFVLELSAKKKRTKVISFTSRAMTTVPVLCSPISTCMYVHVHVLLCGYHVIHVCTLYSSAKPPFSFRCIRSTCAAKWPMGIGS